LKYQPGGNRKPGCPLKRLLDCYIEIRAGHKALVLESITMVMMTVTKVHSKKLAHCINPALIKLQLEVTNQGKDFSQIFVSHFRSADNT
jgi:hypothetical protein